MKTSVLTKKNGQKIVYVYTPATEQGASLPAVMFLGGFKSDMTGTKALYLEEFCQKKGQAFVRFDYTRHGGSDGAFEDGTIGSWASDARDVLDNVLSEDVILVGSSMGGWIGLNLLLSYPDRIKGMVGIAAAPDFTQSIEPRLSVQQKAEMEQSGKIIVPSSYGSEPYVYTKALIEDGKRHLLLDRKHNISVPLILLQGKQDDAIPWEMALKIKACFQGPMTEIILIEDGDHRLSRSEDLMILGQAVENISRC